MLKLSKISKVILFSGMLLAFSCVDNIALSAGSNGNSSNFDMYGEDGASSSSGVSKPTNNSSGSSVSSSKAKKSGAQRRADRSKKRADNARAKANTTNSALEGAVGSGQVVTKHTTTTTITADADGRNTKITTTTNSVTDENSQNSAWQSAQINRTKSQGAYTSASTAYNKCLAGGGDCSDERAAMEKAKTDLDAANETYNTAQKDASDAFYANQRAQEKAAKKEAKAEKKQLKADEKALKKAERELKKCQKDEGADCSQFEQAVKDAQNKVDSHSRPETSANAGKYPEIDNLVSGVSAAGDDFGKREDALKKLKDYADGKENAAKKAEAECERYSAMTSKSGQKKAQEACAAAVALRAEADAAAQALASAKNPEAGDGEHVLSGLEAAHQKQGIDPLSSENEKVQAAERRLKSVDAGGSNSQLGIVDISSGGREISMSGGGANSLSGYRSEYFNYDGGGDVLELVTRRAALAVVSLKPIVYIFAGFGLIAFAWMAIFNKISWKWFANIAMGLFLVANMGRLIEYFVGNGSNDGGYYIGAWDDGAKKGNSASRLANATKDIYHVYGETGQNTKGIRQWSTQEAEDYSDEITSTSETSEAFQANARKFCQGTSGSGWANFTSCIGDIVSTAKKAVNTVKTVAATVEDVQDRIEAVGDNWNNIVAAANNMKGASLSEIINNAGTILDNANSAFSTTTGAFGSIQNSISSVSNDIQDLGKSTDQQQELAERRASGEATNSVDAAMKGQEWDKNSKGVEMVDGEYAENKNGWNNFMDGLDKVTQGSDTLNNQLQEGLGQLSAGASVVENFSAFGSKSINETRQEKQAQKAEAEYRQSNAGKNDTYNKAQEEYNGLVEDYNRIERESKQLATEYEEAKKTQEKACAGGKDSELCKAATDALTAVEAAKTAKEEELLVAEVARDDYKENDLQEAKDAALASNIETAQKDYNNAAAEADKICSKNQGSKECSDARKKQMNAAQKLTDYRDEDAGSVLNAPTEEEKAASLIETTKTEKNNDYKSSVSETNRLYDEMKQQEQDIKNLENDIKNATKAVEENCKGDDDTSALCKAARSDLEMSSKAKESTEALYAQTQSDYGAAKEAMDVAYDEALKSNIAQAEQQLQTAQSKAEEACAVNAASKECSNARREAKKASETLSSYIDEQENKTNKSKEVTNEDVDKYIDGNEQRQDMKKAEQTLAYEQEQAEKLQTNEATYAAQEYSQAVDEANTLYTQMKSQEKEASDLEKAAQEAQEKADEACAKNSSGSVCATAQLAAKSANEAAENKKEQVKETQKKYTQAQSDAETAYNKSVQAGANQAQRDYDNAQTQAETAQAQIQNANARMPEASAAAQAAERDYNQAKEKAAAAQSAYNQAVAQGKSQSEINRLNQEYQEALSKMVEEEKEYKEKNKTYQDLQKQKSDAEKSYNEAYAKSNDAGSRLSSYTNEQESKTGESRLNSQEDLDNQALLNQYTSETNPNAVAQASRGNYIETQNRAAMAKETLRAKENQTKQAKKEYEAALKAAQSSGSAEDFKKAERLKQSYDLAVSEEKIAANEYAVLEEELKVSEAEYREKAAASEAYMQETYTNQMKAAATNINKYEIAMTNQRKVVEDAAARYTEALSSLEAGDAAGQLRVAQLYNEYNEAKKLYTEYQAALQQARSTYNTAQKNYQNSVAAYDEYMKGK